MIENLIEIQDLKVGFEGKEVLHGIHFHVQKGEIVGIVGESGSGKSLTSLAIMGLLPKTAQVQGSILFEGKELINTKFSDELRGNHMGMIFQEPMTSLNPSMKCGKQVIENILLHQNTPKKDAVNQVIQLFEKVKLPQPQRIFEAYPHELSGGQKQRVMIAMAIASNPKLLIADEPTTALDVTVQKSILKLLKELQRDLDMSIVFISHDLGVIAEICDRVIVMYKGEIVEQGDVHSIFHHPKEPYTQGLIACRPKLSQRLKILPTVQDFTKREPMTFYAETQDERKKRLEEIYWQKPILEVHGLRKYFKIRSGFLKANPNYVKAVEDVSFTLFKGETLGLVGESGSGKTTLSRTLLMLDNPTQGEIWYQGKDLAKMPSSEIRKIRKDLQIIFQDPYSSLNPRHSIGQIITEPMKIHKLGKNKNERKEIAAQLLEKVDLQADDLYKYPHEFSGGQRQRVGIARALALKPKIIICDESVSALDVSVQAQVLNLLNQLKEEFGLTYLFISHDLSVVKHMSDRLIVLRHGEIKEYGDADKIYQNPQTTYTQNLIESIPKV